MIRALAYSAGNTRSVADEEIAAAIAGRARNGFLWVHLEGSRGSPLLDELPVVLPPTVERALTATETRPRCEPYETGVLVNLRAPPTDGDQPGHDPLMSVRLWAEKGLLLSVAFRASPVIADAEALFEAGSLTDPGDVIIAIASAAAERIDEDVAGLGDRLDDIECSVDQSTPFSERREVTALRTRAIGLRRFIVPQRLALERLASLPLDWLDDEERAKVREAGDRFARMGEELESVRERAAVIHDELTDLRSERIDARSLQIAIVALIFLPLTFITGLLGMNVEGIPYAGEEWAFWGVVAFCIVVAAGVAGWFIWRRWSER